MTFLYKTVRLLFYISRLTIKFNTTPTYCLFFSYYVLRKINRLLKMQFKLNCIPNEIFSSLLINHRICSKHYTDENLYALCNSKDIEKTRHFFYLCCKASKMKYKIVIISTDYGEEHNIYVSESMKFNIYNQLKLNKLHDTSYFLFPAKDDTIQYATELRISLISNPYDYGNELMNSLLQNFFSIPKYVRLYDIFGVNVKKHFPEVKYCTSDSNIDVFYFKVNNVIMGNEETNDGGCFVVYGKTTLIQEANINYFLPSKCLYDTLDCEENNFCGNLPPVLKESLIQLQACIAPFLQDDIYIDIKPIFLVEGPTGSGKSQLIKTAAQTLGLHLLEADFTEVQSLTSAQTEAKLRIILHEAENCVPCLLMLQNIQIFGINSEGQKDDRVLAAFGIEVKKIYSKKLKYPLIIVATSNDSEILIDSEKTFVEKIKINHFEQEQRCQALSWIIRSKNMKHNADLQKIAKMCSDFVLADFEALVLHAIKNRFKLLNLSNLNTMELTNDDFIHACEYMQSIFSDQIGAPRVPKVYWEDIGGLADLKREIMRRIEMPLLNIPGMTRSGLLLYGPPGTGKTLLAKAVATECQLHFLSVKGPELLNMYVGQSEKNVRQVFERARAAAPCIIFFDELDSLAPNRGQSGDSGGVMDRVVSQLLAEMDGLESSGNIFIIAATNRPDLIDPALLRPGRFDKMLYVGIYSDPESQLSVIKALVRHFNMEKSEDDLQALIAELPSNLTGADLYSVCSNAWLRAVRRTLTTKGLEIEKIKAENIIVKLKDFVNSSKDLVPSVSKEEMLRYEKLVTDLSSR